MKALRTLLTSCIVFVLLFSLSGCFVINDYKYFDDINPSVVSSISIYDTSTLEYSNDVDGLLASSPAVVLEKDQIPTFLNELGLIRFNNQIIISCVAFDPAGGFQKYVLSIVFNSGNFLLLDRGGYSMFFDSDGNVIDHYNGSCKYEDWMRLITKYYDAESTPL